MKVLLIGNYAADRQYSMQAFAETLLSGMRGKGVETRLIAPAAVFGKGRSADMGLGKWLGYFDKLLLFPLVIRQAAQWADVVHVCDQGNAFYTRRLQSVPHLVTCHDLMAVRSAHGEMPDWRTGRTGRAYQRLILQGINQARFIACASDATRSDLLRISRVRPSCVTRIYNGQYRPYSRMAEAESERLLETLGLSPAPPFLLHVGGNQPYKNREGVLRIFCELRQRPGFQEMRLVMAGKALTPQMQAYVTQEGLASSVTELTDVDDNSLRALYSRAAALVFPSHYEGFGLPIIEAQACGCPVFTSDRAPMTEVGGSAAVYFDPESPSQAAGCIAERLASPESIAALAAAGFKNVQRFTTDRMLEDYLQVYRRVVEEQRSRKPDPALGGAGGTEPRPQEGTYGTAP